MVPAMGAPVVHRFDDAATGVCAAAAGQFRQAAAAAVAQHDSFRVALSGGSTPRPLYELLATEPYRRCCRGNPIRSAGRRSSSDPTRVSSSGSSTAPRRPGCARHDRGDSRRGRSAAVALTLVPRR
jgi:hypothetical protein